MSVEDAACFLCVLFLSPYTRGSIRQHPVSTNSVREGRARPQKRKADMAIKQGVSPCRGAADAIRGTILARSSSLWEVKHEALSGMCISELPWTLSYIKSVSGLISTPLMELSVGTRHLWLKSKGQRMKGRLRSIDEFFCCLSVKEGQRVSQKFQG